MRFLVDECTGPAVADYLRARGHHVLWFFDEEPGLEDTVLLGRAYEGRCILITNDKDFGDFVYRSGYPHCGVVLLRLSDERSSNKIEILSRLLDGYAEQLTNRFVVVTEKQVRFAAKRMESRR
jgi:predicted nuclease of predicted toxin-antitoxin system